MADILKLPKHEWVTQFKCIGLEPDNPLGRRSYGRLQRGLSAGQKA